jgi:hypothetical protein
MYNDLLGGLMKKTKLFAVAFHLLIPFVAAIVVCSITAIPAQADGLSVSLSPLSDVAAGSTGHSFDVLLTNGSGSTVSIEAFFFEVLTSSSDVTFTDATTATGTPYVFGSNSLFGPDIIGPGSTATDLSASDLDAVGSVSLDSGATVGLGHVLFDVSPTAQGQIVNFSLVGFPGTSLSDDLGNDIPIQNLTGGQFTINGPVSSVPEPGTLILLFVTLPLFFCWRVVRVWHRSRTPRLVAE